MNPAAKLAAFTVVLAAVVGGGAALGSAVGPIDVGEEADVEHGGHEPTGSAPSGQDEEDGAVDEAEELVPGGVLVSQAGYTLEPDVTVLDGAPGAAFTFRITGPDGEVLRDYQPAHERDLHLVVVGRDLRTYAHLHPSLGDDGTWSVRLPALEPGAYRAFADFAVDGGPELTLGVDLTVPGAAAPAEVPEVATTDTVDGYDVTLTGSPVVGTASEVELSVSRDGSPVADLEPYLGAAGHLVAIRGGDLAYLHVHPLDDVGARNGPAVRFAVEVPSPGTYRLYFDFAHRGEVRTAAFTVEVPPGGDTTESDAQAPAPGHDADHQDEGLTTGEEER